MKRKIGIISVLLVIVISTISIILLTNKDDNKSINFDNALAYYYEQENGNYVPGTSNAWSTGEYVLDIEQSNCNGEEDPEEIIDWDPSSNGVLLKANENISCTLYFDKKPEQEKFFESLLGKSGKGELLYHNSLLENSAEDNGYRYSGDNPNNFICFGPGSENYNKGVTGATCPDGNLYRIIGYVPVELSNGTKENRIKVIKSEYATKEDLEKENNDGKANYDSKYIKLKRVKNADNVDGFYWNIIEDSTWESSTLYTTLNNISNGYLHKLNNWAGKIEDVQWNVAGSDKKELPKAKEVYDDEWSSKYGASTKVTAKIGLMYPSDYGFASSKQNWIKTLEYEDEKGYSIDENRENNWLYNAVDEWTIMRNQDDSDIRAYNIVYYGGVNYDYYVYYYKIGVRPVFYLNSHLILSGGDGTETKPYKVN